MRLCRGRISVYPNRIREFGHAAIAWSSIVVKGTMDMKAPDQTSIAYWLPLITAILGFASGGFFEWMRDRRTYKREREARDSAKRGQQLERRNEFQRQTLLELQDAAMKLMQATSRISHFDIMAFRKHGRKGVESYPEKINSDDQIANAQTALLGVRVRDEAVRTLLQQLKDHLCAATVFSTSEEESEVAMCAAGDKFAELNQRIGQVLRLIDDEEM